MRAFLATLGAVGAAGSLLVLASVAPSTGGPAPHAVPDARAGAQPSRAETKTVGSGPQFLTSLEIEKSSETHVAAARAREAEATAAALRAAGALRARFPGFDWLPEWMREKAPELSTLAPSLIPVPRPMDQQKLEETLARLSRARMQALESARAAGTKEGRTP